jgi:hypothetical protein
VSVAGDVQTLRDAIGCVGNYDRPCNTPCPTCLEEAEALDRLVGELQRLQDEVRRLSSGSEIPALREMVSAQVAELEDADARLQAAEHALREAIQVLEWCGTNDRSKPYEYGDARPNGDLPRAGSAFNTPREFARYWVPLLTDRLAALAAAAAPSGPEEPQEDGLFEFRRFLDEVRVAATSELVNEYTGWPQDELPDPADLHEDIRETLWPFFEQIRSHIEGPPCPHTIPTSLNTSWRCILPADHEGPCRDGRRAPSGPEEVNEPGSPTSRLAESSLGSDESMRASEAASRPGSLTAPGGAPSGETATE